MSKIITEKGKQKILGMANKRPYEKTTAYLYPDFAKDAIRCVDIDEVKPQQLSPSSPLKVEWQCPCGNTSIFKMIKMLKERKSVLCYDCKLLDTKRKNMQKENLKRKKLKDFLPIVAEQFVRFVDHPELNVESVSMSSTYEIEWKCSCNNLFVLKPANKHMHSLKENDILMCPECIYSKRQAENFGKANMEKTIFLKDYNPLLYSKLMRLEDSTSVLPLSKISSKSAKIAIWKCNCGLEFARQISTVTNSGRAVCQVCSRNGESLFELEMKELLEASLNLEVISQHHYNKLPKVDIFIPKFDIAIQFDPYYYHKGKESKDFKINEKHKLAYSKVIRIREEPLKQFVGSISISHDIKYIEKWLEATLKATGLTYKQLNKDEYKNALVKANTKWNLSFNEVENNITTSKAFPIFVENLTHPGRRPDFTPISSSDICLWKCERNHYRKASPSTLSRKGRKNECSQCKRENNSIATKAPELTNFFVKYIESKAEPISTISVRSTAICLWQCTCGYPVVSSITARYKAISNENYASSSSHKRHIKINLKEYLTDQEINKYFPNYKYKFKPLEKSTAPIVPREETLKNKNVSKTPIAVEFRKNISVPSKPLDKLGLRSNDICLWECQKGHQRKLSPRQIFSRGRSARCNLCVNEETKIRNTKKEQEKQNREQERIAKTIGFNFPCSEEEFLINLDSPKRDTSWISKTSREMCIWKCRKCNQYLKTQVRTRWESYENDFVSCLHDTLTLEQVNEYLEKANLPVISE